MALLDAADRATKAISTGRYMAATFNLLRGRDLIWSYVVNNYLLGEEPAPFDLLHWNGDITNLPASWHRDYLETLYKGNKLVEKGGISVLGVPIDLSMVKTPTYIQAGREDHIAPPQSVWKIMDHFAGPKRFVLAGSGHIAGRGQPAGAPGNINIGPTTEPRGTLEEFIAGATEHKGSWWPDWMEWLKAQDPKTVKAKGARVPGKGKLKAIEDAPGRYVKSSLSCRSGSGRRGPKSAQALEDLQRRASLALDEYREAALAPSRRDRPAGRADRAWRGHRRRDGRPDRRLRRVLIDGDGRARRPVRRAGSVAAGASARRWSRPRSRGAPPGSEPDGRRQSCGARISTESAASRSKARRETRFGPALRMSR